MTADHLRPVLDNIRDTHLLHQMGEQSATARTPPGIHPPWKSNCIAEAANWCESNRCWGRYSQVGWPHHGSTLSKAVEAATAPQQCAPSTRAGRECVAHGRDHVWPNLIWPSLFGRIWPIMFDRIWPDRIWRGLKGWTRRGGARRGGDPNPEKVGPEGLGAQNFALFFLSPTTSFILSSLSGGSSGGILVVFVKCRCRQMCTFGVLGLLCEAPARGKKRMKFPAGEKKKSEIFGGPACEGEGDVVAVIAPLGGVAQVNLHGV